MIPSTQAEDSYPNSVVLSVAPKDFAAFIRDLLGKPQSLRGRVPGVYDIDAKSIETAYHLVNQRVAQNPGELVQFVCRVNYTDGSSVVLNSLDDFLGYREVRSVISSHVNLSWVYLLSFPDIPQPQRQEIDVRFESSGEFTLDLPLSRDGRISPQFKHRTELGSMHWEVRHTMRTWGADIDGLLRNLAATLQQKESPTRIFLDRFSIELGVLVAAFFVIAAFMMVSYVESGFLKHYEEVLAVKLGSDVPLQEKVDVLIRLGAANDAQRFQSTAETYRVFSMVVAFFLAIVASIMFGGRRPSFVALTEAAVKQRSFRLEKYRKSGFGMVSTVVVSVFLSVAANFLYEYWCKERFFAAADSLAQRITPKANGKTKP